MMMPEGQARMYQSASFQLVLTPHSPDGFAHDWRDQSTVVRRFFSVPRPLSQPSHSAAPSGEGKREYAAPARDVRQAGEALANEGFLLHDSIDQYGPSQNPASGFAHWAGPRLRAGRPSA